MSLLAQVTQAVSQSTEIPAGKLAFAAVNAGLNSFATLLLVAGLALIKQQKRIAHQYVMLSALIVSAVFLASYLTSKVIYGEVTTGMVSNGKAPNWAKGLYLFVLVPHLIAAVGMLPMIGKALWHAYKGEWTKHRAIARPTWFIWFYVSISGVLVYWLLYQWMPSFK